MGVIIVEAGVECLDVFDDDLGASLFSVALSGLDVVFCDLEGDICNGVERLC